MAAIIEARVDPPSLRELELMAGRLEKSVPEVLKWLAREAAKEVRQRAPVGPTGRTKKSIRAETEAEPAVASDWFVARLQERGYRAHRAWIKRARRWVDIPGKPYKPDGYFIQPGVEAAVEKKVNEVLGKVVEKL